MISYKKVKLFFYLRHYFFKIVAYKSFFSIFAEI